MKLGKAAGAALMILALAVPAIADAEEWWWFDHKQGRFPVSTFKKVVEPSTSGLKLKTAGGKFIGPCEGTNIQGEIYSKFAGMGEGDLTKTVGTPKNCTTTLKECELKKMEPPASPAWALTLTSSKKVVISNFKITIKLVGKCEGIGLPEEFSVSGTVEGTWIDAEGFGVGSEVKFDEFKVKVGAVELSIVGGLIFGTQVVTEVEPEGFAATTSPAELEGENEFVTEPFFLTRTGNTVECERGTLEGTAEDGDTTLTVKPTYTNCSMGGLPATVKMNGCTYLLHLNAELVAGEEYAYFAPTDLKCEKEKELELEVFFTEADHKSGKPLCRFAFGETGNQAREVVELTNEGSTSLTVKGWINAHVEIGGLSSKRTAGSPLCGAASDSNGKLEGMYEVWGAAENGIGVFPG